MTRVYGVMSTFRPDGDVILRALNHASKLNELIIVDDGSPDSSILDSFQADNIRVVKLPENVGIAGALNTGLIIAHSEGADFLMTLDQDSLLDGNYLEQVVSTFHNSSKTTRLGIVLTDCVNNQPSKPPKYSPEGFGLVEEGIQSGMVISAECFEEIGGLDERLFIDCVDTEYCLRASLFGWKIAVAPGSNIIHSLGQQVPFKPFGITQFQDSQIKTYQYHPPFRRYYITRNNLDLCIRNILRRPRWVASVMRREITPLGKVLLSGPHAQKHWLAVVFGLFHGITRRRGKIPNWLGKAVRT